MNRKTLHLIALYMALSAALHAQFTKSWDKRFGGGGNDNMYNMRLTADGGFITGGSSDSGLGGDKSQGTQGGLDYWIVRTDAGGGKLWDRTFGGTAEDALWSLVQSSDGGFLLGGYSLSGIGGDKTVDSRGGRDYWVVKTDADGNKLWDNRYGGTAWEQIHSVQETTDGGFILGGYSQSGIGFDKTETNRGGDDYWIVKIASDGTQQWDRRFGGTAQDNLYVVQQTADGGYILGGRSASPAGGDKTQNQWGGGADYDFWAVKVSSTGVKQWDRRYGGTWWEELFAIHQLTDGYIFGGYTQSGISGDRTTALQGAKDYWIIRVNTAGVPQWEKRYGSTSSEEMRHFLPTSDGGYILAGPSMSGIGGDKTEASQGMYDYWFVKVNSVGVFSWDKRYGGNMTEWLYGVAVTTDGCFVGGGYSASGIAGDRSESSQGLNDFWMIRFCQGALPVELVSFSGRAEGHAVRLKWQTASEANTDRFVVEKSVSLGVGLSLGNNEFIPVGSVRAAGLSKTARNYSFTDLLNTQYSVPSTLYYRMKITDLDGSCQYSNTIAVQAGLPSSLTMSGLQVTGGTLHAVLSIPAASAAGYELLDMTGSTILTGSLGRLQAGMNRVSLDLTGLPKGMYYLTVSAGGETATGRVMVQR